MWAEHSFNRKGTTFEVLVRVVASFCNKFYGGLDQFSKISQILAWLENAEI